MRSTEEEITSLPGFLKRRMAYLALAGWSFTYNENFTSNYHWWRASKVGKPMMRRSGTLHGVLNSMRIEYREVRGNADDD